MSKVLNGLVALIGLFCALMWLGWQIQPADMALKWHLSALDLVGTNNLRGDVGGVFLAGAVFCGLYFGTGAGVWLRAAAVGMGTVLVGRIAGLALDGFAAEAAGSAVIEIVFITVFLAAASRQPAAQRG
jgi:hypothetical protein